MKTWTQAQARPKHAIIPDGLDQEFAALRASGQAVDRTQLPASCIGQDELAPYAMHRVWTQVGDPQTNFNDANLNTNKCFLAASTEVNGDGWVVYATVPLTGHQGGSILVNWGVSVAQTQLLSSSSNLGEAGNPSHIGLRVLINGLVVGECIGPARALGNARLIGAGYFPAGDLTASLEWKMPGTGPDDIMQYTDGTSIMKAHLWASKFVATGRWR